MKSTGKTSTPAARLALCAGVLIAFCGFCDLVGAFLVVSRLSRFSPIPLHPAIVVESAVIAPIWAFASYKLIRYWHRKLKYRDDQCAQCGYSIVGNRSGHCPECGQVISLAQLRRVRLGGRGRLRFFGNPHNSQWNRLESAGI